MTHTRKPKNENNLTPSTGEALLNINTLPL